MLTDPIADMLTRVRNAAIIRAEKVDVPASRIKLEIAKILKEEGFIRAYKILKDTKQGIVRLTLKYIEDDNAITGLKRISKPGRRVYVGSKEIAGSWTTAGLMRSMNALFDAFTREADNILAFASCPLRLPLP